MVGGLHAAVTEYLSSGADPKPVTAVGIPDRYVSQGTQRELREECGLTENELYRLFEVEKEKNDKKD